MKNELPVLRFIAGSGRSGTTWVQDALAEANGMRAVFEPLNPYTSRIAAEYANRYLDAEDVCEDLYQFMKRAATGEMHTLWTHYRILTARLVPKSQSFASLSALRGYLDYWRRACVKVIEQPSQRSNSRTLVKCVRANLVLDWLCARFDARIVLLIRHPGAVVESQLRSAYRTWNPYPVLEGYRNSRRFLDGPLSAFSELLSAELSPPEALTLVWCIQNLVPLSQARRNGYAVVFYEELLEEPERHWPRICKTLELQAVPESGLLEVPSQQASARWDADRQFEEGYTKSYGRWRSGLDPTQLSQIQSVLERAGVKFYDVNHARPIVEAADDIIESALESVPPGRIVSLRGHQWRA